MKKKRKMVYALLLLSVLGFSGCQKEQRKAEVSKSDFLDQEIPDHVGWKFGYDLFFGKWRSGVCVR